MKNDRKKWKAELLILLVFLFSVVFLSTNAFSFTQGPNNRNVSVDTRLNVTGFIPEVIKVDAQSPVTLNAGTLTTVFCNATILDYNGFDDIQNVSATIYDDAQVTFDDSLNNNTLYRNESCQPISQDGDYANYSCAFRINYYANATDWNCTIVVNDTVGLESNNSNTSTINTLFALNVTNPIDFGKLAMGNLSSNETANVSNLGNVPINVSVEGYGGGIGDGLSFRCQVNNLTVDLLKFSANSSATYLEKVKLTSGARTPVPQLTVQKPLNNAGTINTTYWQVYLNNTQNVFGVCNGTIIFQADSSI